MDESEIIEFKTAIDGTIISIQKNKIIAIEEMPEKIIHVKGTRVYIIARELPFIVAEKYDAVKKMVQWKN